VADLVLRDRMGGGNYGQVYEGVVLPPSDDADAAALRRAATARDLPPALKRRRVVLKRVNADGAGVRAGFLRAGTIARGAAESGEAEAFFTARVAWAGGGAAAGAARYLGQFTATESARGFTKGTRWLVRREREREGGDGGQERQHKTHTLGRLHAHGHGEQTGGRGGTSACVGDVATRSLAFSVGAARRTRTRSLQRQKEKGKRSGAHQPTQQGGARWPLNEFAFFFFVLAHSSTALFALPRTPLSPSLAMRTARAVARLAAALRSDAGRRGVG
jgi:hypothetical protein